MSYLQKHQEVVAKVLALFISKKEVQQMTLDNLGVVGDKFYNTDIHRSVLITSTKSYNMANQQGINLKYGLLGENILIDHNPYDLPIGTKIHIGTAIIEISQHCTICKSLTKIDNSLPKLLKNDRGVFAKVLKGGVINIDDKITI